MKEEIKRRLHEHLQTAILLELSTLPPYLCAYWSIHGSSTHAVNVKKFILSVVQEEMLHMAMACNILNATGGHPAFNDASKLACFPCALPGHSKTNNGFVVQLSKCSPAAISTFLKIEMPDAFIEHKKHADGWCTIGEFYCEIEELIKSTELSDEDFNHGRQVSKKYNPAHGVLHEVYNREDALRALDEIIDQGEGHAGNMYDKDHQLTHYWKFKSIGDLIENGIWNYESEVYNMASNPDEQFFTEEAKKLNKEFNEVWTSLLDELCSAFNSDVPKLKKSIDLMFLLQAPAVAMMQIPLAGRGGNAGPTFSYISSRIAEPAI